MANMIGEQMIPRQPTKAKTSGGAMVALLVIGIPVAILRAWVLQHLWEWFVRPTFHLATPQIAVIYGLTWVVGLLWPTPRTDDEPLNGQTVFTYTFTAVFLALIGLLCGAVAHGFVR